MAVPSLSVIRHGCLLHSLTRADLTLAPAPLQWRDTVSGPGNARVPIHCTQFSRGLIFVGLLERRK